MTWRSFIYSINERSPNIDPWGIPDLTDNYFDL